MNRRFIVYVLCIVLLCPALLGGCSRKVTLSVSKSGFYLDTVITITLYGTGDGKLINDGFELCAAYEKLLSTTKEESDIYRINHSTGPVTVDEVTALLIRQGIQYYELSDGLFDIAIGSVSELWDFTSDAPQIPDAGRLADAVTHVNASDIEVSGCVVSVPEGMKLDLGGIAKGYIADKLEQFYRANGVTSALLNLGGNIWCIGNPPDRDTFRIGIKKPFTDNETCKTVEVREKCVVTSGVYERCFTDNDVLYHHVLDPSTGYPCETDLYSVTIIGKDSMEADALSTICLMLGNEKGAEFIRSQKDVQAVFVTNENVVRLPDE